MQNHFSKELQRGVHARLFQIETDTVQMGLYSFYLAVMVKIVLLEEEKYTLYSTPLLLLQTILQGLLCLECQSNQA